MPGYPQKKIPALGVAEAQDEGGLAPGESNGALGPAVAPTRRATAECVEKDRDQVATPARLRAMAAREQARRPDRWSRGRGPSAWRLQGYWPRTLGPQRPY